MMSGTSADGIDAALVEIRGAPPELSFQFRGHYHRRFPSALRKTILRIANAEGATSAGEISQLNFRLGEEFAHTALEACKKWSLPAAKIDLIGSHGQTIFHQGLPSPFLGSRIASTLQIGDPCVIAARTGVTTVADFRPADVAAGGQGAPLVPFVDYLLYRDARRGRVALNIGGIANVTVIPRAAKRKDVIAFDTGPGNMVVDATVERITRGRARFDRDARIARRGKIIPDLLEMLLCDPYLVKPPPKTAGREQFGRAFTDKWMAWGRKNRARNEDLVRTATAFTSLSIADAFRRFIFPKMRVDELIVTGGGAGNPLMMEQLARALPGIAILEARRFGVPAEAKEAFAFAALAYEAFHGRTNNLPSATGAGRAVVMGKIVNGCRAGKR